MPVLDTATRSFQVSLGTNPIRELAIVVDFIEFTYAQNRITHFIDDTYMTRTSGINPATILPPPEPGKTRDITKIAVTNINDSTLPISFWHNDNDIEESSIFSSSSAVSPRYLYKSLMLDPGDNLQFSHGKWRVITKCGSEKQVAECDCEPPAFVPDPKYWWCMEDEIESSSNAYSSNAYSSNAYSSTPTPGQTCCLPNLPECVELTIATTSVTVDNSVGCGATTQAHCNSINLFDGTWILKFNPSYPDYGNTGFPGIWVAEDIFTVNLNGIDHHAYIFLYCDCWDYLGPRYKIVFNTRDAINSGMLGYYADYLSWPNPGWAVTGPYGPFIPGFIAPCCIGGWPGQLNLTMVACS